MRGPVTSPATSIRNPGIHAERAWLLERGAGIAKAAEIEISDDEIDQTYARVAQQNMRGADPKAMDAYLTKIGSSSASLKPPAGPLRNSARR